jgi:hypothetical protein
VNTSLRCRSALSGLGFGVALLSLATPGLAAAVADEFIVTDRPAFVVSTRTVDANTVQVETSVERSQDGEDANLFRTWTTPTLLRYGLKHQMEIRLESDFISHVRYDTEVTNGVSDISLGLKGTSPRSFNPNLTMAWMVDALLPTGTEDIGGNGVRPSVRLAADWQFPNQTSLGVMPGCRADRDDTGDWYPTGMLGVNVAHNWNPRVRAYAEMSARTIRSDNRGGKNVVWDLGGAWRVSPDTQLDGSVGFGLKENDTDLIWTLGLSRRFTPRALGAGGHH